LVTAGSQTHRTILPLLGNGAMRLTTSRYYTPSGRSIQAEGIAPDIIVEQAKIETLDTKGQRREADLRGALENKGGTNGNSDNDGSGTSEETAKPQDYQLDRALDLIQGIALYSTSNGASN